MRADRRWLIGRFALRAIAIAITATVVWWFTRDYARAATIAGAKGLHRLVGYPAPYLLADLDQYHWFAPLFPPFAGLMLASTWLHRRRRAGGLVIGLAALWYLVALQIAVVYSPYLTLSAARAYLVDVQVSLNSIVVPVLLWLVCAGGLPPEWSASGAVDRRPRKPVRRSMATLRSTAMLGLLCAVLTLPVVWPVEQTTPTLRLSRDRLARTLTAGNDAGALEAITAMFRDQQHNAALRYLQLHVLSRSGYEEAAKRATTIALTTAERRAAFEKLTDAVAREARPPTRSEP